MALKRIVKLFEKHAITVFGEVGSGKDMLFANVVERRKLPHVSNLKYNEKTMPYKYELIDCSGNTYKNFVSGDIKKYEYPYCDYADFYLSDCGIYFPSQYSNALDKEYPNLPTFMSLTRQLGKCHVHTNCQALGRIWNKIREQSSRYILCLWCVVIFGVVIQKVRVYDMYASAERKVPCFNVKNRLLTPRTSRVDIELARDNYACTHGNIKEYILVYRNKSKYDTRHFKGLLERGN